MRRVAASTGAADTFAGVMADLPASVFVERPTIGRVVTRTRPVRLGDVDARARLRLDAVARYLQDIATDDATDAELDDAFGWVVRRTMIEVRRAAGLDEHLELSTFCAGTGRSWAERRTSITGERGASIEAVSLWIRVDPTSGRPTGLGDDFVSAYGAAAAGRRVSSRLQLPDPPPGAHRRPWELRRVDIDPLGHVNNAAQWAIVEETLPADGSRRGLAEFEHRAPVDPPSGAPLDLVTDTASTGVRSSWLAAGDVVLTAARWTPAP
jgi:acyl-ACP thioesterase